MQSVEEMATEISANTILNEILSMEQETAQHEWRLYELQNELISMVSRNSMIEQIYIYFYDGNYLPFRYDKGQNRPTFMRTSVPALL